jgi:hypothetical protein
LTPKRSPDPITNVDDDPERDHRNHCPPWIGISVRLQSESLSGIIGIRNPEKYSGHSLRAGLATAAGDQGAGLADLMRQTRHKSTEVALGYLRPADLWRNNVTERVFAVKKDLRE